MGVKKKDFKVGLATFAQPTFDVNWAESIRKKTIELLQGLGVDVLAWEKPLMYEAEAYEFRDMLRKDNVDAVFLQCGGFSFGGLPVIIATGIYVPCIIWTTPEPEWDGGPIRSNSLCAGIMHNSHLKRAGVNPQFIYGAPGREMRGELGPMLQALKALSFLRNAKLGVVGYRAPGFYCSWHDESKLQATFGVQTFHVDLSSVLRRVDAVSDEAADQVVKGLDVKLSEKVVGSLSGLRKSVKIYLALKQIAQEQSLDMLAVKCWPEFPQEQNVSVCLSLSLLNSDGIITSCEADAYGAVSMLIQDLIGEGPEFFNDLIQIDAEKNHALFWHCGAAALLLRDEQEEAIVKPHGMRGTVGAMNFPLKSGRVTVSRVTEEGSGFKMFIATGEAQKTPMLLQGNPSLVKIDAPVQKVLDTIISEGFEHHYSTIYGDVSAALKWFCRLAGLRAVTP